MKTREQIAIEKEIKDLQKKGVVGNPGRKYIDIVINRIEQTPGVAIGAFIQGRTGEIEISAISADDAQIVQAYFRGWGWNCTYDPRKENTSRGIPYTEPYTRHFFKLEPF